MFSWESQPSVSKNEMNIDVIIIGGGPAGLSAALWCSELGMRSVLFEKEPEFGGQLLRVYNPIGNYLGLAARNGREMQTRFLKSVEKRDFLRRLKSAVVEVNVRDKTVVLDNQERYSCSAIIFATGVRPRKLGVEGEDQFRNKGIIDSGSKHRERVRGKKVVIVGGGDAAIENALILGKFAAKVWVVHRSEEFRARSEFFDHAKSHGRIELRTDTMVQKFAGTDLLAFVQVKNMRTGKTEILPTDNALIRIGVEPNTELLRDKVDLDESGYVIVNANCETSAAGVFAIGDAANSTSPTISNATGTGAVAAKAVFLQLNP